MDMGLSHAPEGQSQTQEKDESQRIFEVVNAFKAEGAETEEIIQLTKAGTLYKEGQTPKELIIPELEPPKKEKAKPEKADKTDKADKTEKADQKKKGKKQKRTEVIQTEVSEEILELSALMEARLGHPEAFTQQTKGKGA